MNFYLVSIFLVTFGPVIDRLTDGLKNEVKMLVLSTCKEHRLSTVICKKMTLNACVVRWGTALFVFGLFSDINTLAYTKKGRTPVQVFPALSAYTTLIVSFSCIYAFLLFCGVRIEWQDTQCVHQRYLVYALSAVALNAYTTKQQKCIYA